MLLIAGLLIISILLTVVYFFPKNVPSDFPEPPGHFFFGHVLKLRSLTDALEFFSSIIESHGKIVKLRFGFAAAPIKKGYLTTDSKLAQLILNSTSILTKSENYKFLKSWLGKGLLISDGDYWRRHRKILTPAFHFDILKTFVETFEIAGNIFVDNLKKYEGSVSFDLHPLVSLCTLDIICETAMGTKINAQNNENKTYVEGVAQICQLLIGRCLSPMKLFDSTYLFTKDFYIEKNILNVLHNFTKNVIDRRKRNKLNKKKIKRMAFLDLLLAASEDKEIGFSTDEIREEVDTFMFEGHDTTAAAICFTLFCLGEYPEIQNKVYQEQKNMFGDEKNPAITYTELQNMNYLENVIKESLRLYPPVPIIGRYLHEDIHFENRTILKNSNIVFFLYKMHRDSDYFPDPEKFNPERFENCDNPYPFTYIPFSAGPRNCIGQRFAKLEMKSVISKVIRHFEIKQADPVHKMELSVEAVLKSNNGIKIGLKTRK